MRLVAWNCAMGLARKFDALQSLRPDIAVLSEVACPSALRAKLPQLRDVPIEWVGEKPTKGLAVISFGGDSLTLDPSYRSTNQYIAPVHVNGTRPFRLLAAWDHNDRKEGLNRRPGPLLRALNDSAEFCATDDLVIAGDFNNNPRWDRPNGPNNMAVIVAELTKRGLRSLHHHLMNERFGGETRGTYLHVVADCLQDWAARHRGGKLTEFVTETDSLTAVDAMTLAMQAIDARAFAPAPRMPSESFGGLRHAKGLSASESAG